MGVDCDAVLWVSMLYCLLVLAKSHLERPLGLPNVGLIAFFTGDLIDHSSLSLLRNAGLDLHQGLSEGLCWFEDCLDPKGVTPLGVKGSLLHYYIITLLHYYS